MPTRQEGPINYGQLYDPHTGVIIPYTEQVQQIDQATRKVDAIADENTEVTIIDNNAARARRFNQTQIDSFYADVINQYPSRISMAGLLPDLLVGVFVTYNTQGGNGTDQGTGSTASVGTSWTLSVSLPARSNASKSLTVEPEIVRKDFSNITIASVSFEFYAKSPLTEAQILTRLGTALGVTVLAWPVLVPERSTINFSGGQISVSANASASQSHSLSSGNESFNQSFVDGTAIESGANTRTVEIPPTLHKKITIPSASKTVSVSAAAGVTWDSSPNFPAIPVGHGRTASEDLTATVSPNIIPATSPTSFPFTGRYLHPSYKVHTSDYDQLIVVCDVIDMSDLQKVPTDLYYSSPVIEYVTGGQILPNVPRNSGGIPDSYSISPSLPSGFVFDTTTGVLTGNPVVSALTVYTVTATNSKGSTTATITIDVV